MRPLAQGCRQHSAARSRASRRAASGRPPAETAIELENLARAILRDAACGHLGSELRSTADEILLADGFAVGEGGIEHLDADDDGFDEPEGDELAGDEDEFDDDSEPEEQEVFGPAGRITVQA